MFLRSGNPLMIFLQSYHVWVTSQIQVDFRFNTYSEVLVNVSYRFLKFLHYLCFSKSRNPLLTFLLSYDVWVTSKIQVNFRFERYWWFCLINFWNFHTIHVFEVRESIADISTELPCHAMSRHVTSCHVMPRHVISHPVASLPVTSCHVTSCHIMPSHATLCHVMPCHVKSCHVMPRHVTSCHAMSRHVTPWRVMSTHVTYCHVLSRHVTSCHFLLPRQVTSCHVTSCHVVSRHATSCPVTLWHVMSRPVTSCHVGCPEGCRYHTASAVYNLVFFIFLS